MSMHLMEDYRKKKNSDDDDDEDEEDTAKSDNDETALRGSGVNPLAEEESVQEDDTGDA